MPVIAGYAAGNAINGAIGYAFKASRFGSAPANGSPAITSGFLASFPADAGPVTTGGAFGGDGSYQLGVPTVEDYWLGFVSGGVTEWEFRPASGVLTVDHNGTVVGTRGAINLIDGTGVSLTVADDATDHRVNVTVTNSVAAAMTSFGAIATVQVVSGTDVAQGHSVTVSGTSAGAAANINDGNDATSWTSTASTALNPSTSPVLRSFAYVDLGSAQTIVGVRLLVDLTGTSFDTIAIKSTSSTPSGAPAGDWGGITDAANGWPTRAQFQLSAVDLESGQIDLRGLINPGVSARYWAVVAGTATGTDELKVYDLKLYTATVLGVVPLGPPPGQLGDAFLTRDPFRGTFWGEGGDGFNRQVSLFGGAQVYATPYGPALNLPGTASTGTVWDPAQNSGHNFITLLAGGADQFLYVSGNNQTGAQSVPYATIDDGSGAQGVAPVIWGIDGSARQIASAFVPLVKAQTLAANGAVTMDARLGGIQPITLQANATSSSITNPATGQVLTIEWIQDATGSRTYVWPSNCKFAGATAPTASTTANRRDSVTFRYDGTNWVEMCRAVNVG